MIELTRNQIATLRGCTPATVTKAKLRKSVSGFYNLEEAETIDWAMAHYVKGKIDEYKKELLQGYEDNSYEGLEAQKLIADIAYKNKQSRKLDLQHAIAKNDLVPIELIGIWIGYFRSGLNSNFLTIAARVSRNNKTLRDKIEIEMTKAIIKTRDAANRELVKQSKKLMEGLEDED